jgi:hypothetical protein
MIFDLTKDNFLIYAIKNYDSNGHKGISEFQEELKRFKYIKKLLNRYRINGILKERLILNHIIILYNVFGSEALVKMIFFKIDQIYWSDIKTFLIYLNLMPENVLLYFNTHETVIPINIEIANKLRAL